MAWITPSSADLEDRMAGAEVTALRTAALATGQSDPVPDLILSVTREVRGYVSAGGFQVGTGNTIPDELLDAACAILRHRASTRLPGSGMLDVDRIREFDAANTLLREVAAGRFVVSTPLIADATSSVASPSLSAKPSTFNRESQAGI